MPSSITPNLTLLKVSQVKTFILGIHPVTAGRCAEKGKKLIEDYGGIWDILEKRS